MRTFPYISTTWWRKAKPFAISWLWVYGYRPLPVDSPLKIGYHTAIWSNSFVEVYKIVNQIDRIPIDKFFTINDQISTCSNGLKLFKKRSRLNVRANVFSNRVVNAWNLLPSEVVLAPSLNSFKSRLNKFWYGHPLKFTPSCYIPGETVNIISLKKMSKRPLEVV